MTSLYLYVPVVFFNYYRVYQKNRNLRISKRNQFFSLRSLISTKDLKLLAIRNSTLLELPHTQVYKAKFIYTAKNAQVVQG